MNGRAEPTNDQSWCDLGIHAPACSGYTKDELDAETCFCDCHCAIGGNGA